MRKQITASTLALLIGAGAVFATKDSMVPDCPLGNYDPVTICGPAYNVSCCYVTEGIWWFGTQWPAGVTVMGTSIVDP